MIIKTLPFGFGLCLLPALAASQTASQTASPISTDRPTFSDSASLLSKGQWQFESGTTANTVSGSTSATYGELLTRYGLSNRVELRFSNLTWMHVPGQTNGFVDPSVGLKFWLQTGSLKRPDLAAEFMTTLPIGAKQFGVNRSQPTLKLLWNQQIDANTAVAGNFLVSDLGEQESRFTQWAQSVYLSRTLNPKVTLLGEIYRLETISYGGPSGYFYDIVATYLLNNNLQLDARFGAGFDPQRDGHTIGFGVSYRY